MGILSKFLGGSDESGPMDMAEGQDKIESILQKVTGDLEDFEDKQDAFFRKHQQDKEPSKDELMALIEGLEEMVGELETARSRLNNLYSSVEQAKPRGGVGAWRNTNKGITENVKTILDNEESALREEIEEAKEMIQDEQQGNHEAANKLFLALAEQVQEEEQGLKQIEKKENQWSYAYENQ